MVGSVVRARSQGARASLIETRSAHPLFASLNPRSAPAFGRPTHFASPSPTAAFGEPEFYAHRLHSCIPRQMAEKPPNGRSRPRSVELTLYNVVEFLKWGNHCRSSGLPGGAEGIRTDGHRGLAASYRRSSLTNIKVSYGQIASANFVSTFVHKPQILLAFCLSKSNGRVRAQGRFDARRIDPPMR